MSFPPEVAEAALLDCGRHCCLCHRFRGTKIELHHIRPSEANGADSYDNCIPLCFDCHAEVKAYDPKHPKGRKYTESELKEHRNRWYAKVRQGQGEAVKAEYIEVDRRLYDEVRQILPSDVGSIPFLRFHEFAGSFPADNHSQLMDFMKNCIRPEFEFLDFDLEAMRTELAKSINHYLSRSALLLYPVDGIKEHRYSVPQEWRYGSKESQKAWQESVDELNDLGAKVSQAYDDFIRLCRRRLAC